MDKKQRGLKARNDGYAAETVAAWYLRLKGYRILARNFKPPRLSGAGEIDIIARKGNVVAFVEVKQRKTFDDAAYCIDERTKARRIAGAQYYLSTNGEAADLQPRFDAVLISAGGPPVHLENAWECESL